MALILLCLTTETKGGLFFKKTIRGAGAGGVAAGTAAGGSNGSALHGVKLQ